MPPSVYNAYKGFYVGRPPITGLSFIGLPSELSDRVFNRTLELYFGSDDKEYLKSVEEKAALIGLTRVMRRTLRREDTSDTIVKNAIEFYKMTISDILDRVDNLDIFSKD